MPWCSRFEGETTLVGNGAFCPLKRTVINQHPHCMSSWAKSKFLWGSEPQATIRAKTEERMRRRDLLTSFGGFLTGCYICFGKPPKLVRRSHRRSRSSVLLRYSLRKTSTTKSRAIFSLRMTYSGFVWVLSVRKTGDSWIAPTENVKISRRGDHWSSALTNKAKQTLLDFYDITFWDKSPCFKKYVI